MIEFVVASRVALGIVFIVSAVQKSRAPHRFSDALRSLVPPLVPIATPVAYLVIALEAAAGISNVTGFAADAGVLITTLLLLSFVPVVVANALRFQPVACHCFGEGDHPQPRRGLLRLVLLLACAGVVATAAEQARLATPTWAILLSALGSVILASWCLQSADLWRAGHALGALPPTRSRRVSFREAPLEPLFISVVEKPK